jgi:hypothetical protein
MPGAVRTVSLFKGLASCVRIYIKERMHETKNDGIDFVCGTHGMDDSKCALNFGRKMEGMNQLRV